MRRWIPLALVLTFVCIFPFSAMAGQGISLSVSGLVKQPLVLDAGQLAGMSQVRVKHNGVSSTGKFNGVFWFTGVSLRNILEMAAVSKEAGGFHKHMDLAVVVRSRDGRQVTFSWGEIFHKNPSDTVIALSSTPVMPKKSCKKCHEPAVFLPWLKQLSRQVGMPKLVVTGDLYNDRSLENVASIEVTSLGATDWGPKMKKLFSPGFKVSAPGIKTKSYDKLPALPRREIAALHVGEGKGFHGHNRFKGIALRDLLKNLKIKMDLNTVFLVSAPDGYQSLVSYGELFLSPSGGDILLADRRDGKEIDHEGRFQLILPGDLWADRWVKSVGAIRAASLAAGPRLSIIGVGCGETNLITLRALTRIRESDVLVAPADIQRRFAYYLKGKPVLFDPMKIGKKPFRLHGKHKDPKAYKEFLAAQKEAAGRIKAELAKGRRVAVLDWGDPMVYGSWRWLNDHFAPSQLSIVSGLSAFNAGSAALVRDITSTGAVTISDPFTIMQKPQLAKSLAANRATLVIFMGMPKFPEVMAAVAQAYGPATPVRVVLRAGYARQKVISGTLGKLDELKAQVKEKWLGVIFIGPALKAKTQK